MKVWLSIAVIIALSLVGNVWMMFSRDQAEQAASLPQLEGDLALRGRQVATAQGCIACHSLDGSRSIGPSWLGMFGKTETLVGGETVVVDEDYFRESIRDPGRRVVEGYQNVMIPYFLSEEDMEALLEFARQMGQDSMAQDSVAE